MCSADRISENVRGVGAGLQADPHLPKGGALPQTSLGLRQRCHVFLQELEFHAMENDQRWGKKKKNNNSKFIQRFQHRALQPN